MSITAQHPDRADEVRNRKGGFRATASAFSTMSLATVAVCTHDRAHDVELCLGALAPQAKAAGLAVLLVDSGSTPAIAVELQRMAAHHGVCHLRLGTPGLSLARNAAHEHASSEWIVYLDDDAIPDPTWAKSLLAALTSAPLEAAIIGGKISPKWPSGSNPAHITNRWKLLLSCVDRAGKGLVSEGYNICGANVAVRRSVFEQSGRFPTSLGRRGKTLSSGVDSYIIEKISSLGFVAIYNDTFVIEHCIPPERLELKWIARRAYWEGVSRVRVLEALGKPIHPSMGKFKLAVSVLAFAALKLMSADPDFDIRLNMALGSLFYRLQVHDFFSELLSTGC